MNQTRGERFMQAVGGGPDPRASVSIPIGPNPLQKALEDYHVMEAELQMEREQCRTTMVQNLALVAEVSMLREALERSDSDRIRLQAISSTLMGRLLAINDTIAGAVKASIRDGIEAVNEAKPDPGLEEAARAAQAIIQRVEPAAGTPAAPSAIANLRPPQVDWSRSPQG